MDDKKKIVIVAVLFVVIAAVGAFQFTSAGTPPPPAEKPKQANKKVDSAEAEAEGPKNPLVANLLPPRDPFQEPVLASPEEPPPTKVNPLPQPDRTFRQGPRPSSLGGDLPPFNMDALPGASKEGGLGGFKPVQPEEPPFDYGLVGVIVGSRPAAVFRDAQGNQRLITRGGSLDADSSVESISRGEVVVNFRGKKLRLTMGGNPGAK